MNDTTQLEDALRTLADVGGEPDHGAAWAAIQGAVGHATVAGRRRRWVALASTAAVGAAAAGLLVVATRPSTDHAVEVGPATPGTDAPVGQSELIEPPGEQSQVGTPVVLPEDPAVILSGEGYMVNVMDPGTGAHISTVMPANGQDERVSAATMTAAGDIYLAVSVPESSILARARWDGDDTYEVLQFDGPPLAEGGGYGGPVVDPSGGRLAFEIFGRSVDSDVADPSAWVGSVGILDLQTNQLRHLEWPAGDDRAPLHGPSGLSFSPDGGRLAFVNSHDSDGTELFEVYVLDLATATSLADAELVGEAFDVVFGPDGRLHGLVGDRRFEVLEGEGPALGDLDGITDLTATARGTILARTEDDGWFRHVAGEKWARTGWDGWHD